MQKRYYVEGGVFTDFHFKEIVIGSEEIYGPFDTYTEAYNAWYSSVWKNVDNGRHRLRILEEVE